MQTEILNIEHHIRRMTLKALNTSRDQKVAAEKLGISTRTLVRYVEQYRIRYDRGRDIYYFHQPEIKQRNGN